MIRAMTLDLSPEEKNSRRLTGCIARARGVSVSTLIR